MLNIGCKFLLPGQLRIKYPDITGDFLIVNLTKGNTGLGKLNSNLQLIGCTDILS